MISFCESDHLTDFLKSVHVYHIKLIFFDPDLIKSLDHDRYGNIYHFCVLLQPMQNQYGKGVKCPWHFPMDNNNDDNGIFTGYTLKIQITFIQS